MTAASAAADRRIGFERFRKAQAFCLIRRPARAPAIELLGSFASDHNFGSPDRFLPGKGLFSVPCDLAPV